MKRPHSKPLSEEGGFTLIELIVVIGIVVLLAGIVVGRLDGAFDSGFQDATFASLAKIREAIAGTELAGGFLPDLKEPPGFLADLWVLPATLPSGRAPSAIDPDTGVGWNGPYLTWYGDGYTIDVSRGFTAAYGAEGSHAILDAWRHPIVLQWPLQSTGPLEVRAQYIRLVSAGANGILETPADLLEPDLRDEGIVGDDLAIWVLR